MFYFKDKEPYFKRLYDLCPPDHGWGHIKDVIHTARVICQRLMIPYSKEIELGCILHDVGNMKERDNHHEIGARLTPIILKEGGIDTSDIDVELVQDCVRHHRASNPFEPHTVEERIVSSADRGIPCTNVIDVLEKVLLRAVVYNLTHGVKADECVSNALNWMKATYVIKREGIYPREFKEVFGKELEVQRSIIDGLTLDQCEEFINKKGVFQPITAIY